MNRIQLLNRAMAGVIVAIILSGVVGSSPAAARGRPRHTRITCGQTITESIRVANDLTCEGPAPVLSVTGAGVTVDLNGHVLAQSTPNPCYLPAFPSQTCGVNVSGGATLANGTLRTTLGLQDGNAYRIRTDRAVSLAPGRFDRGRVTDALISGTDAEITRSHLVRSTISFDDSFTNLTFSIRDNLIEHSDADPLRPDEVRAAINIRAIYYFLGEVNGEIVDNRIIGSAGHGIAYFGGGPNVGEVLIAGNDLRGNAQSGISLTAQPWAFPIENGGPLTVRGNRSTRNGGHGIEITAEGVDVVDGGRNLARANALDPQCLGVVCHGGGRT